jgi:hypothetical protein
MLQAAICVCILLRLVHVVNNMTKTTRNSMRLAYLGIGAGAALGLLSAQAGKADLAFIAMALGMALLFLWDRRAVPKVA